MTNFNIGNEELEVVTYFLYLGSVMNLMETAPQTLEDGDLEKQL